MRRGKKNKLEILLKIVLLILFLVLIFFPFYWILVTSLKSPQEIVSTELSLIPKNITFDNYRDAMNKLNFGRNFLNSFIVSTVGAFVSMFISILSAYVLARFDFKWKGKLLLTFLITQMLPSFVGLAPLYMAMSKLRLVNSLTSLMIIYTVMMIPYCTITMRGFLERSPVSLEESAMIDGCNRVTALFRIVLPIMAPGVISVFIFAFVACWNETFHAIIFIDDESLKTIPVALNGLITKNHINWGVLAAGTVMSILPIIGLFAYSQKYIASGLTQGAVKE